MNLKISVLSILMLFLLKLGMAQDQPKGLNKGDQAPEINAYDHEGEKFVLSEALNKGKVVIIFYRGSWCPHCNKHLSKLQDSIGLITAKGASVITITPEKTEFIEETNEKFNDAFSIIQDEDLSIMTSYGVRFTLDPGTFSRYKKNGLDLDLHNGSQADQLPVPATYIIDQNGLISYVHFNEDYKQRANISTILANL